MLFFQEIWRNFWQDIGLYLIIHFAVEKELFNMHSATLLDITFDIRILQPSFFAWCFQLLSLRWITFLIFSIKQYQTIAENPADYKCDRQSKNVWYLFFQFSLKTPKKHLFKTWFTWLVYILCNSCTKFCWYTTNLQFTKI